MKKSKLFKWITSSLLAVTTAFTFVGCASGQYENLSPASQGAIQPSMTIEDIEKETAEKYYICSAVVPGDMDEQESKEYISNLFEDAYLFVDPGPDAMFVNDYKSGSPSTEFYKLVEGQIDLFAQDLYDRIMYVYGPKSYRTDAEVYLSNEVLDISNTVKLEANKAITNDVPSSDPHEYDINNSGDLTYLANLMDDDSKPLRLYDAISGLYTYHYTDECVDDGFSPDSGGVAWNYYNSTEAYNKLVDYTTIKMNIAEILAGISYDDLSSGYSPTEFTQVCKQIDHLGFMQYDLGVISKYIKEVVIGPNAMAKERDAYSYINLISGHGEYIIETDTSNGYIDYVDTGTITYVISGNIGFSTEAALSDTTGKYKDIFVTAHSYKAYDQVIDILVDNVANELFYSGLQNQIVFTKLPRLNLIKVAMNILDGSLTTEYDGSGFDDSSILDHVHYHPVIRDKSINCVVLRVKDGLEKESGVPEGKLQYDEGINITDVSAVLCSSEYSADIEVEFVGKASGEQIVDKNNNNYYFIQSIEQGREEPSSDPAYPTDNATFILDKDKALEDWVGNQFVGYNGVELDAVLEEIFGIEGEEVQVGDYSYINYTLCARLNADTAYLNILDIEVRNEEQAYYEKGYKIDGQMFGDSYLQINFFATNVKDAQGADVNINTIKLTILTLDPQVCFYR